MVYITNSSSSGSYTDTDMFRNNNNFIGRYRISDLALTFHLQKVIHLKLIKFAETLIPNPCARWRPS